MKHSTTFILLTLISLSATAEKSAPPAFATCRAITERNVESHYRIKSAALNLVDFNGMLIIQKLPDEQSVVIENDRGNREVGFMTKYLVGHWFDFVPDSSGQIVPTKSAGASFAPQDHSLYTDYDDDGRIIKATAKFASGITNFVGRHWDTMAIQYDKDSMSLQVNISGGLWGLRTNNYIDFRMHCEQLQ